MSFYYRYGQLETTHPWDRPTWEKFYQWWDEMKTMDGLEDYELYVVGGMLHDPETTWDVDVLITGRPKDLDVLGEIITRGRDLAINKYHIFVDLFWYSSIEFCYEEVIEENVKFYIRGTICGDEVKMRDGVILIEDIIGVDKKMEGNLKFPVDFQVGVQPNEKQIHKGLNRNWQPPILLKRE